MAIGNILIQAEKHNQITFEHVRICLDLIRDLPTLTDIESSDRALRDIFQLARHFKLTSYDAVYLDLALRKNAQMATKDKQLIKAAKANKIPLLF